MKFRIADQKDLDEILTVQKVPLSGCMKNIMMMKHRRILRRLRPSREDLKRMIMLITY